METSYVINSIKEYKLLILSMNGEKHIYPAKYSLLGKVDHKGLRVYDNKPFIVKITDGYADEGLERDMLHIAICPRNVVKKLIYKKTCGKLNVYGDNKQSEDGEWAVVESKKVLVAIIDKHLERLRTYAPNIKHSKEIQAIIRNRIDSTASKSFKEFPLLLLYTHTYVEFNGNEYLLPLYSVITLEEANNLIYRKKNRMPNNDMFLQNSKTTFVRGGRVVHQRTYAPENYTTYDPYITTEHIVVSAAGTNTFGTTTGRISTGTIGWTTTNG